MKCTARGGIDGGRLPRCSDGELVRAISAAIITRMT
jgi:hypothetical protein